MVVEIVENSRDRDRDKSRGRDRSYSRERRRNQPRSGSGQRYLTEMTSAIIAIELVIQHITVLNWRTI